jgi:hypothetical protein
MKKITSVAIVLLLLQSSLFIAMSPINAAAQTDEILNNNSIVEMVKAELSEEIIISLIKSKKNTFDTSSTSVLELKKAGISDAIVLAMVQASPQKVTSPADDSKRESEIVKPIAPENFKLYDGTPIKLRIGRTLSSADAKTGETVDFEVLEDLKVGDIVIITRGAVALATVTRAKPKGRLAKGGKLDVNIDSVRLVSGESVALRAVKQATGNSYTGTMTGAIVATSILFFPAAPFFLFLKGKDISIPKGTEITAYINGEVPLDYEKFVAPSN